MRLEKYCRKCGEEVTYPGWIGTIYAGKKFCECKKGDLE